MKYENPSCYKQNNNPYPLCIGNKNDECKNCCLYEDYEKYHDPYEQYHK